MRQSLQDLPAPPVDKLSGCRGVPAGFLFATLMWAGFACVGLWWWHR